MPDLSHSESEIIFLGTGTSEGVPRVSCLTREPPTCMVCRSAMYPGSRNRRRNTSLLVRYAHPDGRRRNIVIDVGKFFWHAALDWFVRYRVPALDAVVLTHAHADAIGGLDDLRDWTNASRSSLAVHLRPADFDIVRRTHFYIVEPGGQSGGGVPRLDFRLIDETPFEIEGLQMTPLPVPHGQGSTALGYRFGNVAYISDASDIPDATAALVQGAELIVLDALRPRRPHDSHLILEQALDYIRRFRPRRALLTDMTHDFDHDATNADLSRLRDTEGLDVQLAYDGLRIPVAL